MSGSGKSLHIEWLVACLSPHDVAPHPNFSTESASGPELLALLTSFSWREYFAFVDSAKDSDTDEDPRKVSEVLLAAQEALDSETALLGAEKLEDAARNDKLSLGERVAAGLLGAVSFSELDQPERAVPTLEAIANALESALADRPSKRLAQSAIWQQCALRTFEAGDVTVARNFAGQVVKTLSSVDGTWDDFEVSRGISWTAAESQQRLVEHLRSNAESLLVTTGDPFEEAWTEIVRAPAPIATIRPTRDALSGLTTFVDEVFEHRYSSHRRRYRLGGGDTAARLLYSSLLNAELTGDLGATSRYRGLLGSVFAVRIDSVVPERVASYREALRLLRQADSEDHLTRLTDALRRKGPLDVLKDDADHLIRTRSKQSFVTSADLMLLRRTADLYRSELTDVAILLAIRFCRQARDGRVKGSRSVDWRRIDTSISAVADLLTGNPDADMDSAAEQVLELLPNVEAASDQFLFSSLAKLADAIKWERVTSSTKARWVEVADSALDRPGVLAIDALRLQSKLDLPADPRILERLDGLQFVTALIGGMTGDPPRHVDLKRAVDIVSNTLATIMSDAERGQFTTYTWSPFALAAYLISRFARSEIWPQLAAALAHPRVLKNSKIHALEILTDDFRRIAFPRELIAENPIPVSPDKNAFFPVSIDYFDAVCRNFYIAAGTITPEEAQAWILRDSGSADSEVRAEAARGSSLVSSLEPSLEWPAILLLQSSHDRDAIVANRGARYLGYLSTLPAVALQETVYARVEELLKDQGIALPMGVLNGIAEAMRDQRDKRTQLWCHDLLASLQVEHLSRNIHIACERILSGEVG